MSPRPRRRGDRRDGLPESDRRADVGGNTAPTCSVAQHEDVVLIDDRTHSDLDHSAALPPPMASLDDQSRVVTDRWHVEALLGWSQLGWIRARSSLINRLVEQKSGTDLGTSAPMQIIAAETHRQHHDTTRAWRNEQLRRLPCCARIGAANVDARSRMGDALRWAESLDTAPGNRCPRVQPSGASRRCRRHRGTVAHVAPRQGDGPNSRSFLCSACNADGGCRASSALLGADDGPMSSAHVAAPESWPLRCWSQDPHR